MVKKEWFKTYRHTELPPRFEQILQSWDTANKITELSDFSVCTTWGCLGKTLYLLDVYRNRLEYPDLKRAIVRLASQYRATTILIEDKSSGTQLIQDLIRDGLHNVKRYKPVLEKGMRLLSVTSTIENGFVFLPDEAPWLDGYLHEITTFPGGKYDDQTDSTSQALDWIKGANLSLGLVEYCKSLAEDQGLSIDAYGRLIPKETAHSPTAINPTTGQRIRWDGRQWRDCNTGEPYVK